MRKEEPIIRFVRHILIDPITGCWNWTAYVHPDGYGHFNYNGIGKCGKSHRFSYEYFNGPIPEGLEVDHLCRNRKCANPDHLEAVTKKENWRRGFSMPRINLNKTHCKSGHEFTDKNTYVFHNKKINGRARICRICHNKRSNEHWHKKYGKKESSRAQAARSES